MGRSSVICVQLLYLFVLSFADPILFRKEHRRQNVSAPMKNEISFGVDPNTRTYSYVNKFGDLVGFSVDLVKEVCEVAGLRCYVLPATYEHCMFTAQDRPGSRRDVHEDMDYGGEGLMSRWFDSCLHYEQTNDQLNTVDFSLPFLTTSSSFSVLEGNPLKFDPHASDYSQFRMVHVTGHAQNAQCLTRMGKRFNEFIIAKDFDEAKNMITSGKADVLFSNRHVLNGLHTLAYRPQCGTGMESAIFRKGTPYKQQWDEAFEKYYFDGGYTKLCEKYTAEHGVTPRCLPGPDVASSELIADLRVSKKKKVDHLWTFSLVGRSEAYSFLDRDGILRGFTKDLIDEVCKRANKQCTLVLAMAEECTRRKGDIFYAGRGLLESWFGGCTGYYNTPERRNSYDFTKSYLTNYASFSVLPGNPKRFDPSLDDYSKWTIVYKRSSETNQHCLNRLKKKFKGVMVVGSQTDAVNAVLEGKADAFFATRIAATAAESQLEELPHKLSCDDVGTGIMLRKGSKIKNWWDPAFDSFYESGEYNRWCDQKKKEFAFDFPCLPEPEAKAEVYSTSITEEGF